MNDTTSVITSKHKPEGLPGNVLLDEALVEHFERVKQKRGDAYTPRTRHLTADGQAKYTNRLFLETSPYLLQHAHNPVNWYPWGEEAFKTAGELNRPVFLSIGYSTCHWCHVMEEESFEDEEIAAFINRHYVPIKVDREERPDVDAIYMEAVQALTGGGGWPLNMFLTPAMKPFYGGTYFPARDGDRGANTGFLTVLRSISESYKIKKDIIEKTGDALTESVRKMAEHQAGSGIPAMEKIFEGIQFYKNRFDGVYGGLSGRIKFPSSLPIRLLFRYFLKTGDEESLSMALHTLKNMGESGMYDHVGGGFHRYSTDEKWLVPHFEKMLYDNALLAVAYTEAWQLTGEPVFKTIACEILDYVKKEMTSAEGGFFSAQDADSMTPSGHMEEGYFFTWTKEDIRALFDEKQAGIIEAYFHIKGRPNFEGRYILHRSGNTIEKIASDNNLAPEDVKKNIREGKAILYTERQKRKSPLRDEKILTAWNGLMISAFAKAGFAFTRNDYTKTAEKAASFILDVSFKDSRLLRSHNDGESRYKGYLSDYAFFIAGLLDLYEATFDTSYLKKAIELDRVLSECFEDKKDGGFFMTGNDHEKLITRGKPADDGAIPSGNAVAIMNLLRLGRYTDVLSYSERAEKAMKLFLGSGKKHAAQVPEMLLALDFYLDKIKEIVIVAPEEKPEEREPFLEVLRKRFLPNRIVAVLPDGKELERQSELIPLLKGRAVKDGKTTVYICENRTCKLPVNTAGDFSAQLEKT